MTDNKKKQTKKTTDKKPESLQSFLNDMGRRLAKEMSKDLGK